MLGSALPFRLLRCSRALPIYRWREPRLFQSHSVKVIIVILPRHTRQTLVGREEDCVVQESHKDILLRRGRGHAESEQAEAGIREFAASG